MTDKPTPTDAELKAMWQIHAADIGGIFDYARAVLAKWGTPAGAAEPECTCSAKDAPFGTCCKVRSAFERWYDEQNYGRLQPFDVFKGGWIERHRLSSTPQPTQAQAGAVTDADYFDRRVFARAIESEVRKQDTEMIRQLVAALSLPCDRWNGTQSRIVREAISAGRARLDGKL